MPITARVCAGASHAECHTDIQNCRRFSLNIMQVCDNISFNEDEEQPLLARHLAAVSGAGGFLRSFDRFGTHYAARVPSRQGASVGPAFCRPRVELSALLCALLVFSRAFRFSCGEQ